MSNQYSATTLHLLSALVVRSPFDAQILPQYEANGGNLRVDWNPTSVMVKNIDAGQRADALLLTIEMMDEYVAKGIVDASTRVDLLRSNIGIAVMPETPSPDIGTAEALKQALLKARSVAYSIGGASGIYFAKMIQTLGIADEINEKATTIPEGFTAEKLISGEADMAVQQISELLTVRGIKLVGPLPPELQKTTSFAVAAFAGSPHVAEAREFIQHLTSAESRKAYEQFGLNPI
jgi:molybdate transport system substrate-binding protein